MRVDNQRHAPAALPSGKSCGTRCREGWMGPGQYGKDLCERKHVTSNVVRTRNIQPVQRRCTNDQHAACVKTGPLYSSQAFYMSMSQSTLYLRKRTMAMTWEVIVTLRRCSFFESG